MTTPAFVSALREATVCPRCSGTLVASGAGHRSCIACGWDGPTRAPTAADDPDTLAPGKLRHRAATHNGVRL